MITKRVTKRMTTEEEEENVVYIEEYTREKKERRERKKAELTKMEKEIINDIRCINTIVNTSNNEFIRLHINKRIYKDKLKVHISLQHNYQQDIEEHVKHAMYIAILAADADNIVKNNIIYEIYYNTIIGKNRVTLNYDSNYCTIKLVFDAPKNGKIKNREITNLHKEQRESCINFTRVFIADIVNSLTSSDNNN